MIKLFRNFRQSLLSDGKTRPNDPVGRAGKYLKYAIGEILLVMIGILLALQVNNWNNDRLDQIEEQTILKNLKEDFSNAIDEFESISSVRNSVISAARNITSLSVSDIDIFPVNYLDSLFAITFNSPTYNNKTGSLSLLLSSGKINLITNPEIRNSLIEWPGDLDDMKEGEVNQDLMLQGPYKDLLYDHLSFNDNIKYIELSGIRFGNSSLEVFPDNPVVSSDYASILSNKRFFNILRSRVTLMMISNNETYVLIEKAKGIIAMIDSELNKY